MSILECGHIFVVSQANRVFHSREVSTTSCYLEEMLLWGETWGGRMGRLIDRTYWTAPLNYCSFRSVCIRGVIAYGVSWHLKNQAGIKGGTPSCLSYLPLLPPVWLLATHPATPRTPGCPSSVWGKAEFLSSDCTSDRNLTNLWVWSDFTYVPLCHEITKYDSTKLIQGGKNRITAVKVFSWQSEARNITHTFLNVKDIKEMS